jgi:hypothetical protein
MIVSGLLLPFISNLKPKNVREEAPNGFSSHDLGGLWAWFMQSTGTRGQNNFPFEPGVAFKDFTPLLPMQYGAGMLFNRYWV